MSNLYQKCSLISSEDVMGLLCYRVEDLMDVMAMLAHASNIGPVRVNHKVSTTGDGTRKQGDVKIQNFPLSRCDSLVIDVSFVCEFTGSSRALGGWNNSVRHTHDVLKARATVKNNKCSEAYSLVAFAPAIIGMSGQIHADFLRLLWVLADKQMWSYYESMGKEDKIGNQAFQSRLSTPTRLPLVGPLLLAAPPVAICLCIVLRYLTLVQDMTFVEVVLDVCSWGWFTRGQTPYLGRCEPFREGGDSMSAPLCHTYE